MDRRQFIVGAIALASLGWGDAAASPTQAAQRVATAYRDALRAKRFLLVLVVPADPTWVARYERQHAFGSWLTYADRDTRSRLGSAVLVAATAADLAEIVPQAAALGEPLMVLVDPHVFPASVKALDADLLPVLDRMGGEPGVVDRNVARIEALVAEALPRAPVPWDGKAPSGASFWLTYGCGEWPEDPGEETGPGYDCGMGHVPEKSQRFLRFFTEGSP